MFLLLSGNFSSDIVNPNTLTRLSSWPIAIRATVPSDIREEMVEIVMTAVDKFHWDTQEIPNYLKKELDTRFGCSWHVVVGEEFGFDVDVEVKINQVFLPDRWQAQIDNECSDQTVGS